MNYICHSGGCPGSDMEWENEGNKYGVKTVAYSFWNHSHNSKNPKVLTVEELKEGFEHVKIASVGLKRSPNIQYQYVKNLLSRNWYQVKNAESVYAIGTFIDLKRVNGGTGWAVQMAIDNKKPVYVFDQKYSRWDKFNYEKGEFEMFGSDCIPKLTENFAGIGTRNINENGKSAIKNIYELQLSIYKSGHIL